MKLPLFLAASLGMLSLQGQLAAELRRPLVKEETPEMKFQGEYVGEMNTGDGSHAVGIQILALGEGKYHLVGYLGGLPGAGWNGLIKREIDGEIHDGVLHFKGQELALEAKPNGEVTIMSSSGSAIGNARKTERKSPTLGQAPPAGAIVLFDVGKTNGFSKSILDENGLLTQGATSEKTFRSGQLHLEFQLSFMPAARGQGRANSGCYLQGRYEVQILDSFGLAGKDNECGGIYGIAAPKGNMCFPPLSWQTYDIDFRAAQFDEMGTKIAPAKVTVKHNGVTIHQDLELPKSTAAAPQKEGPLPGPVYLQNHGNEIRFRNIWLVPAAAQTE